MTRVSCQRGLVRDKSALLRSGTRLELAVGVHDARRSSSLVASVGDDVSVVVFYGVANFDGGPIQKNDASPPPVDAGDEGSAVAFYGSPGIQDSGAAPDGAVDSGPGGSSDASDSG
jgi:hypothetical protein